MMRSKNGKHSCTLLAVLCSKRKSPFSKQSKLSQMSEKLDLPPAESPHNSTKAGCVARDMSGLVTAGQIEVHVLECPKRDELKQMLESLEPEFLYFQGDHVADVDEIGPLEFADGPISSPDSITTLFGDKLPELVYLETAGAGKLGEVLQNKGVGHVIFWKGSITFPWAAHFRQALIAVLRSSASQVWSAFQLASASFKFYRGNRRIQGTESFSKNHNVFPVILGDAPSKIPEPPKAKDSTDIDGSTAIFAKVQIYDDDIELPLLVLAEPHGQESPAYGALEDGLNALLTVEVKGMRLLQKVSASPPPSSAPNLVRGVVTMRCDLCTSASARISLLVSGSAQTCFDDQMLEYSIKKELLEKSQLVSSPVKSGECGSLSAADLRKSAAIACGALVREVRFRSCSWGVQVLRQLAPEVSFQSLVALGIAGVQGFPVAAFQKEDTDRFSALRIAPSKKHELPVNDTNSNAINEVQIPSWLVPPPPSKKRQRLQALYTSDHEVKELLGKSADQDAAAPQLSKNCGISLVNLVAAMRPVPHILSNRDMPYAGAVAAGAHNAWSMKVNMPNGSGGKSLRPNVNTGSGAPSTSSVVAVSHGRQNVRAPSPAQIFSLNTIPMKKHGCNRPPMQECSEEEFRKDVMQFLISRGHSRLVPSTDLDAFPDAVLNGKKLDLYNLYKEVVSRGGFHVGNGINWKGQVFSKMHNHTLINKMTGVGNTLKKHYETFLLEYELAHDDVDGECCILCHSSAAGDWVNCGICGEWAHLGCDKRSGLGAFKEYAKTDGLEYICPRCSAASGRSTSSRKRFRSPANGYS